MVIRTDTLIADYLQTMEEVGRAIPQADVQRAVDVLFDCWRAGGAVFAAGNGGSASTATHLACDLAKATIVPGRPRLRTAALVDNVPLNSAWTNDSGFESVFAEQLESWIAAGDVLVVLSVHGGSGNGEAGPWSRNLGRAVALARRRGARIIGLSGFGGGDLARSADAPIVVPIDSEPLGTPIVESWHVAIHHLLCLALRRRIEEAPA